MERDKVPMELVSPTAVERFRQHSRQTEVARPEIPDSLAGIQLERRIMSLELEDEVICEQAAHDLLARRRRRHLATGPERQHVRAREADSTVGARTLVKIDEAPMELLPPLLVE